MRSAALFLAGLASLFTHGFAATTIVIGTESFTLPAWTNAPPPSTQPATVVIPTITATPTHTVTLANTPHTSLGKSEVGWASGQTVDRTNGHTVDKCVALLVMKLSGRRER
jgi:hypothetical protein